MSGQNNLEFDQERLESRQPIAGFPELHWTGKRPFTVWQFYPAQLKEVYGEPDEQNGWMNKIYWGDNFQVMNHLMRDFRGKIDLIYIDPPFDSKADYKKKIEVKKLGLKAESDFSAFEEKQYKDLWMHDEYLQFMFERLLFMRELLIDTGSIYVHCDWHKSHYLRCLMDEVFGINNFRNEIIWAYSTLGRANDRFAAKHDAIFSYGKT
ncbi:MAG: site-specific DNA-methyltransferase, partial [Synergistaceae bacterium]|nr:site-specific DNA-methyltransferase [Synergistaceae bacterium]